MSAIRVLIVEDSVVVGEHLRRIISADPRLEVAGVATSGEEALEMVDRLNPDVISMDIRLPGMQGFEATRLIMAERPTPIVVVSGMDMEAMTLTMQALRAGALAVVEKPSASTHEDYSALAGKLCTQLVIMSDVRVVRQRPVTRPAPLPRLVTQRTSERYRLLGIAASTGGPGALMQLLSGLGADFPLPIVLVQHMTPSFLPGFAQWLSRVTPFAVSIMSGPTNLKPGTVVLAPPMNSHMVIDGLTSFCDDTPPIGGHRPSANALFSSMARSLGSGAIGVLLTGMGDDGALGIRELRRAGSYTIAEDESTAVVFGMPAAAVRLGGIDESLPLGEIAPRVLRLVHRKWEGLS
jgi:two-component system, chemotaxis family, protein-glutamate methylesterase/glutaminase